MTMDAQPQNTPVSGPSRSGKWRGWIATLFFAVLVLVAFTMRDAFDVAAIQQWIHRLGPLAWLAFMSLYAIATVLFLPGSVLTLAGGALFGPLLGTFVSLTGATIGAVLAFLSARHLGEDWVRTKAGPRLGTILEGVEAEGWRFVAFVRLVPLFPFNLLNYALGLTRIPLLPYLIATWICMLPGAVAYTWLGYVGRETAAGGEDLIRKGMLALGLLAAVAFMPSLIKRFRGGDIPLLPVDDLKKQLDAGEEILVLDVRDEKDFHGESGRVAGSINIPLLELEQRLSEVSSSGKCLAVLCHTQTKSTKAVRLLRNIGLKEALLVTGGMKLWNERGYSIEKDD